MSKPLILMYHRIADEPVDYWGLAVSPRHFEEQLAVLRRTRHPLPLAEFVRKLIAGTLPPAAVTLTFDDGYVDNLVAGLPRLAAADVPATVFLATGYVDGREAFWWDELVRLILLDNRTTDFELVMRGESMLFELGTEPAAAGSGQMPHPRQSRQGIFEAIYQRLRRLDEEERGAAMIQLRSIFGDQEDRANSSTAMSRDEVRTLVAGGLVTLGAHTVTHPMLTELGPTARRREVADSKADCEALAGAPVGAFAYPYGEFNLEVRETVKTAGFAFACSTQRGPAAATSDLFALPRLYVSNLDGDAFDRRLRWASGSG